MKWMICTLSLLSCLAAQAGGIYRWTDEAGRVHFGERPPPAGGGEAVKLRQGKPSAMPAQSASNPLERQRKALKAFERDREYRRERAREKAAERRQAEQNCRVLRQEWRWLDHGGPIYLKNPDGSRRYLDEGERQRRKTALRKRLDTCD